MISRQIHIIIYNLPLNALKNSFIGNVFRSKLERERERDISEQIALGLPAKSQTLTGEAAFDQRLFNTTKGMDSGFGEEDSYNVYDRPWREANSIANHVYRPSRNIDKDVYGDDLDRIVKTNR